MKFSQNVYILSLPHHVCTHVCMSEDLEVFFFFSLCKYNLTSEELGLLCITDKLQGTPIIQGKFASDTPIKVKIAVSALVRGSFGGPLCIAHES